TKARINQAVNLGPLTDTSRTFLSRRIRSNSKSINEPIPFHNNASSQSLQDDDVCNNIIYANDDVSSDLDANNINNRQGSWSNMLPELIGEIIKRVEATDDRWPVRKNVVVCGCVCKKWREVVKELVKPPVHAGNITFPSCLKQPGPRDTPIQCLIQRNKKNNMFCLHLAASSSFTELGNSDFLGTKFTIYDSQPPHDGAKHSSNRAGRRFTSKQISPQVPAGNFEIGEVSYKFNLLKSRGPRRMVSSIRYPVPEEPQDTEPKLTKSKSVVAGQTVLRNKAPRWHEHLQCWCLNFHGRVTVASVKNFQLVATVDPSQPAGKGDGETVLLQFGKVGDDMFTMDYRQPLSAFHAFAICLTSFGTKLACE
ncbi:hypothetical protein M8C21_000220, partial [Ambrosia artemisiifolia]